MNISSVLTCLQSRGNLNIVRKHHCIEIEIHGRALSGILDIGSQELEDQMFKFRSHGKRQNGPCPLVKIDVVFNLVSVAVFQKELNKNLILVEIIAITVYDPCNPLVHNVALFRTVPKA